MREALVARGLDAAPIIRPLARIAKAMIHSPETESKVLRKGCDAVQDPVQVQFEALLNAAAKGRTENVRQALAKDRTLASRRGMDNQTLAWVATYKNRPKILELTLNAGADCNTPACDPMRATMACDDVRMGTGVAVTPWQSRRNGSRRSSRRWWSTAPRTTCSRRRGWATCQRCAAISIAIRSSSTPSIPPTTSRKSRSCATLSAAAALTP
jgi:hypothetical protein